MNLPSQGKAMRVLKYGLKRLLLAMNLDVRSLRRSTRLHQHFNDADPITYQYLSDLRLAPSIKIDLCHTRAGILGFPYGPASVHPLANAFEAARGDMARGGSEDSVRGILSNYYNMVQPRSALEVVDLDQEKAPGLLGIPLYNWVMPWSERSIEDTGAHRRICLEEEGLAHGKLVSISDGVTLFGPVSEKKLSLEVTRIANLARSMEKRGFQSSAIQPIEVIGLRAGFEYRWFVVQGQHRLAACSAFEIMRVPARVVRVVRREDAQFWPHVLTKTFTLSGALQCFDRLFEGRVCGCASAWVNDLCVHRSMETGRVDAQ
jgi:hypothetical protein